jgi:hypothetical protein
MRSGRSFEPLKNVLEMNAAPASVVTVPDVPASADAVPTYSRLAVIRTARIVLFRIRFETCK